MELRRVAESLNRRHSSILRVSLQRYHIEPSAWIWQIPVIVTASWDGRIAVLDATVKGVACPKRRMYPRMRGLMSILY